MRRFGTPQVRRIMQWLVAAVLLALLLVRLHLVSLPLGRVLLVLLLIILSTGYWWAYLDEQIGKLEPRKPRNSPGETGSRSVRAKAGIWLRRAWGGYVLLTVVPILMGLGLGRRVWDALPVPALVWLMVWHMLVVMLASLSVIAAIVLAAVWWIRRFRVRQPQPEPGVNASRRRFLVGAGLLTPLAIAGGSAAVSFVQSGRFRIHRVGLSLPRWPTRLRGFTITHLSDMHLGRLFRPEHLPYMVDQANKLNSDMVVVTGDLLDHSNDFLPPACEALAQLQHRHGRYLVIGNHDTIDSSREFINYVRSHEPGLLIDEHVIREIGGETVQIGGLNWSGRELRAGADPGYAQRVRIALHGTNPNIFTLALVHHPHTFENLADSGVDLTLAGHTHGGQLMLTPPDSPIAIGAGNLLFRYIWGVYRRGSAAMYVNSGVGNWFPLRVNAPPEMVQIQLI